MKNCKGIFKSLHNRELCDQLNQNSNSFTFFQTGEDLANLPVLPLQQDLTTLLTLGIDNAERNGHHFFPGLKHLSEKERNSCVLGHPDLYQANQNEAHLKIENGKITGKSLLNIGYGYTCEIDFESRTPVESWRYEDLKID